MKRLLLLVAGAVAICILAVAVISAMYLFVPAQKSAQAGDIRFENKTDSLIVIDRTRLYAADGWGTKYCPRSIILEPKSVPELMDIDPTSMKGTVTVDATDRIHLNAGIKAACYLGNFLDHDWQHPRNEQKFDAVMAEFAEASRRGGLSYQEYLDQFQKIYPPATGISLINPDGTKTVLPSVTTFSGAMLPEKSYRAISGDFVAFDFAWSGK